MEGDSGEDMASAAETGTGGEGEGFIEAGAPFLAQYWQYLLGAAVTLFLAGVVAFFLTPAQQERAPNGPERNRDGTREGEGARGGGEGAEGEGGGGGEGEGGGGGEGEKKTKKKKPGDTTGGNSDEKGKAIVSLDKGEHPLDEFEDERPDPALSPTLHDSDIPHIPYKPEHLSEDEMKKRSHAFYHQLNQRRSIRHFSSKDVPQEVIENIVLTAGTSPSGAHSEPWTFVVVRDTETKTKIREIVEQEEYLNYDRRMGEKWVRELQFVRTNHEKPYLNEAPYIIIVFKQAYHVGEAGVRHAHYYYEISTAIASGILITAIHNAGLCTVTTTPLNAGVALRELLGRPDNEKVMLLLPVGYPSVDATVPDVKRKSLNEIMVLK